MHKGLLCYPRAIFNSAVQYQVRRVRFLRLVRVSAFHGI